MSAVRMFLASLIVVGALAGSSTALADPPVIEPAPPIDDFTLPAGDVCSFPVFFEIVSAKGIFKFFSDGRLLITGQLKVRLTNLDSPEKALALNVSGPGSIDASGNETLLGSGILILGGFDADGPALLFTHGRFVLTRAPDGSIANIEAHGTSTDLCAALA